MITNQRHRTTHFRFLGCLASLVICACGGTSTAPVAAPAPTPEATLTISAKSLSAGVGYSWGKGTLEYQGKTHTVSMDGLLVLAVGITSVDARGSVYNLKSLEDFAGRYEAVRGSSALGTGGAGIVMRNEKGVEVRMVSENTGVTLNIGDAPVKFTLD